jgi:hypothetical protein
MRDPVVAPNWPPSQVYDDYLSTLPKRDWAWEFLRRNRAYQGAASASPSQAVKLALTGTVVPVFRLPKQEEAAREWALCSFRRPSCRREHRARFLVPRSAPNVSPDPHATCMRWR